MTEEHSPSFNFPSGLSEVRAAVDKGGFAELRENGRLMGAFISVGEYWEYRRWKASLRAGAELMAAGEKVGGSGGSEDEAPSGV